MKIRFLKSPFAFLTNSSSNKLNFSIFFDNVSSHDDFVCIFWTGWGSYLLKAVTSSQQPLYLLIFSRLFGWCSKALQTLMTSFFLNILGAFRTNDVVSVCIKAFANQRASARWANKVVVVPVMAFKGHEFLTLCPDMNTLMSVQLWNFKDGGS